MTKAIAGLLVLLCFGAPAQACRGFASEQSLYVTEPLTGLDDDVIARVSIEKIVPADSLMLPAGVDHKWYAVIQARVDAVVKGEITKRLVKIAVRPSSCGPHINESLIGSRGLIAGRIAHDQDGITVLFARTESQSDRERRLTKS
jgi:hypothetical protein